MVAKTECILNGATLNVFYHIRAIAKARFAWGKINNPCGSNTKRVIYGKLQIMVQLQPALPLFESEA